MTVLIPGSAALLEWFYVAIVTRHACHGSTLGRKRWGKRSPNNQPKLLVSVNIFHPSTIGLCVATFRRHTTATVFTYLLQSRALARQLRLCIQLC